MGKDKRGAERLQCSDCDCEEYEQPLNGHDCGIAFRMNRHSFIQKSIQN